MVDGSPDGLIAVLARHRVEHLLLPEPDLEQAFLSLYEEERDHDHLHGGMAAQDGAPGEGESQ